MNARKLAEALRLAAEALEEDVDATPDEHIAPAAPKSRPRERRHPAPLQPVSDTDRMRAMKMLRRRGIA